MQISSINSNPISLQSVRHSGISAAIKKIHATHEALPSLEKGQKIAEKTIHKNELKEITKLVDKAIKSVHKELKDIQADTVLELQSSDKVSELTSDLTALKLAIQSYQTKALQSTDYKHASWKESKLTTLTKKVGAEEQRFQMQEFKNQDINNYTKTHEGNAHSRREFNTIYIK